MKDERRKKMENNDKVHDATATTYSVGVINRKRKSKKQVLKRPEKCNVAPRKNTIF
jgi:hypothetical protein